jgi:hypothetical protein
MSLAPYAEALEQLDSRNTAALSRIPRGPRYGGGKIKRGADRHYPLMKVEEIAALPVNRASLEHAHLYLWVTNNYLARGRTFEVVPARGASSPVTVLTWRKLGRSGTRAILPGHHRARASFADAGAPPYKTSPGRHCARRGSPTSRKPSRGGAARRMRRRRMVCTSRKPALARTRASQRRSTSGQSWSVTDPTLSCLRAARARDGMRGATRRRKPWRM